jgi:CRISPR/Cas system-associated protein Csx1
MLKLKREKNPGEKWWEYKKGRKKEAKKEEKRLL